MTKTVLILKTFTSYQYFYNIQTKNKQQNVHKHLTTSKNLIYNVLKNNL